MVGDLESFVASLRGQAASPWPRARDSNGGPLS